MTQRFQAVLEYRSHGLRAPDDPLDMARTAFLAMRGCRVVRADLAGGQMRVHVEVDGLSEPVPMSDVRASVECCLEGHVALRVLHVRPTVGTGAAKEVERILGSR